MARTEADASLFGISYIAVADIFSKTNSSPQTTDINAKKRAATLMKWVHIGGIESAFLLLILTLASPRGHRRWPILGGVTSLVITYGQYIYAKESGLKSDEPGTEDYGPVSNGSGSRVARAR